MNNWTITGCSDHFSCPSNSENSQKTEQELGSNETANVVWPSTDFYQCFRITHFGSVAACANKKIYGFDVKKIDFYGYLYSLINKNSNSNVFFNINCISNYLFIFIFK